VHAHGLFGSTIYNMCVYESPKHTPAPLPLRRGVAVVIHFTTEAEVHQHQAPKLCAHIIIIRYPSSYAARAHVHLYVRPIQRNIHNPHPHPIFRDTDTDVHTLLNITQHAWCCMALFLLSFCQQVCAAKIHTYVIIAERE